MKALYSLKTARPVVVVSAIQAAMRMIPGPDSPLLLPVLLKMGGVFDLYELFERLILMGYERVPKVEQRGQFSARGGIVDVFASTSESPVRMELLGDAVESLRTFSVTTQRSLDSIDSCEIYSCREVRLDPTRTDQLIEMLKARSQTEEIKKDIEKLERLEYFAGIEGYAPFLGQNSAAVFDFVPKNGVVVVDEPDQIAQEGLQFFERQKEYLAEAVAGGEVVAPPASYFMPAERAVDKMRGERRALSLLAAQSPDVELSNYTFETAPVAPILGKLEKLRKFLNDLLDAGFSIGLILNDKGQAERLNEILCEWQINSSIGEEAAKFSPGSVRLLVGDIGQGFVLREEKTAILSHSDIFLKRPERRRHVARGEAPTHPIRSFADLKRGDHVVHVNHGIAVYGGIITKDIRGITRDYLVLDYADGDKLFVPIDQADRVSKYIGADPKPPKVHRLTSTEWLRTKRRVRKSVKELAFDLLALYADRANAPGFAFSPDTIWQAELEEAFQYEETKSQLEVTAESSMIWSRQNRWTG